MRVFLVYLFAIMWVPIRLLGWVLHAALQGVEWLDGIMTSLIAWCMVP